MHNLCFFTSISFAFKSFDLLVRRLQCIGSVRYRGNAKYSRWGQQHSHTFQTLTKYVNHLRRHYLEHLLGTKKRPVA